MKPRMNALKLTLFLAICLTGIVTAQQLLSDFELPPYWHKQYEVLSENNGLFTYRDREMGTIFQYRMKPPVNIGMPVTPSDTLWADTTIVINAFTIDTTLYADRFEWMGSVPIYCGWAKLLLFDSNKDGKAEIYGYQKKLSGGDVVNRFYEWDESILSFKKVVDFNTHVRNKGGIPALAGDIDQDGHVELYCQFGDELRVYETSDSSAYPTELRYIHHPTTGVSPLAIEMLDFDKDGALELLYFRYDASGSLPNASSIKEHVSGDTIFQVTANVILDPFYGTGYFAVEDFDRDGYLEYLTADGQGQVYGVENIANDSFRVHYTAQLPYHNASYHHAPGDLDGDGLPEAYLGGDYGIYDRITVLESCGNDCNRATLLFDIMRGYSLYSRKISSGDVDGDGHKELVLDIGGLVLVFKATGNNRYEIFWAKYVTWAAGIGVGDVDGNGTDDIAISQDIWVGDVSYSKTDVYRFKPSVGINQSSHYPSAGEMHLYPNHPNPFNPSTTIQFLLPKSQHIRLTIYDTSGKEVIMLANRQFTPGTHSVTWDGKNQAGNAVASGAYIVRLIAGQYSTAQKIFLLR